MSYLLPPGLYAVGAPTPRDPVLVTANYKMSYDLVRRALAGRSAWILVLETHGINVWCAAGKGTFGTDELVGRIGATRLAEVVEHRRLVLPLLGAPGVSAHEVRARTGFEAQFAAIRAADIPAWLDGGGAAPGMREMTFSLGERLVLIPVELVLALKGSAWVLPLLVLAAGWRGGGFSAANALPALAAYLGALLSGTVVAPLLLPWLPTRSFAVKGAAVGLPVSLLVTRLTGTGGAAAAATVILATVFAAFLALNFTGCTPFTSRSGVKKEMRLAMPAMALGLLAGTVLWAARWLS